MIRTQTKKISILPDLSLMPKIGQTGYSVSQAISELVDNAIDARRNGRVLTVEVRFDPQAKAVQVTDDGIGMDEQQAANSIKLAHSNKKGQLGEFGLGLKTAATSLGKHFEVATTQEGSDQEYSLEYDEETWLKSGDWTSHEMRVKSGVGKQHSGTTVRISKLSFNIYPNLPGNVREDLAIRFAPYIENGEVCIKVNTKWCEPVGLDLIVPFHDRADGKEEFRVKVESGNEVRGWRGLLKRGSDKGEYGFRVFRRGRLILLYAKVGFNPHPEARQIVGELHLDHVPVTHNKREFIQESPLWKELNEQNGAFWKFMSTLVKEARSSEKKAPIDQNVLDKLERQKESIMKALRKIPDLRQYAFPDSEGKKKSPKSGAEGFGSVEIEKRDPREVVITVEQPEEPAGQKRKTKKKHSPLDYFIYIAGRRFKFQHSFVDLKNEDVLKAVDVQEEKGIHVFTNTGFPAYATTKDYVFYATWHIAEAIAEVMVQKNKQASGEIPKLRDMILKKSADIIREMDETDHEVKEMERLKREYEEKAEKVKKLTQQDI